MLHDAIADIYVYLPAFAANAAPVVVKNLPFLRNLNHPIYATYIGKNKTWRGFLSGLLVAVCVGMLQYELHPVSVPLHEWSLFTSAFAGFLLGCGALVGDMAESWLKRRIGIEPGKALPYLDGVDYILGAMVLLLPLYVPSIAGIIVLLLLAPAASLLANMLAYSVGWKRQWY
jgi:CDP-2,3-bis-(O-geranylgeranyl)-sn-glycerol synthase